MTDEDFSKGEERIKPDQLSQDVPRLRQFIGLSKEPERQMQAKTIFKQQGGDF